MAQRPVERGCLVFDRLVTGIFLKILENFEMRRLEGLFTAEGAALVILTAMAEVNWFAGLGPH